METLATSGHSNVMTPSQWHRVRDLFESLVDLDPADARKRLDAEVGDDPAVRKEIESLLEHHSRAGTFLMNPALLESSGPDEGIEAGTEIGPYVIVREIGRGGMGQVYLADDTRLHRQVCLKAVHSDLAGNPQFRERLKREARLAASLNHPGICAVYTLEDFEGYLYLVTELVEGRTLRDEIAGGHLPSAQQVLSTARELAEALGAAHAKGIVHRDLKPENVMRSSSGRLKILDFGLARPDDELTTPRQALTEPGVLIGTPAYMAPEQVQGGITDRRTDLFALGVLVYEYATGVHPFASTTPLATAARILEHAPMPLDRRRPGLPPSLVAVVERCLRKDPADRFESIEAVMAALDTSPETTGTGSSQRWWRMHQVAVVALYLVVCVTGGVFDDWEPSRAGRWAFVLISVLAAVGGVVRGHLLFTSQFHPNRLLTEARKTRPVLLGLDLTIALAVLGAASLITEAHPVPAVLAMGLAAGIGTTAVFIEPATSSAAIDQR